MALNAAIDCAVQIWLRYRPKRCDLDKRAEQWDGSAEFQCLSATS